MVYKIDDDVPMPAFSRGGDFGEEAQSIMALERKGQSFFVRCTGGERDRIQKRVQVKATGLRQSGRIDFFLLTRQVTERDETGVPRDGLRVWRRDPEEASSDDFDEPAEEGV